MKNELNQKFLHKVRKQLENEGFSTEDFYIKQSSKMDTIDKDSQPFDSIDEDTIVLLISYTYDVSYYFKTELTMMEKTKESYAGVNLIQKTKTPQISVEYTPGTILFTNEISKVKMEEYFTIITQWLSNLREELESAPLWRQVTSHQEKLEEIEKIIDQQANDNADLFFSKEEGNQLKEKLNQLEKILQENLKETNTEEEELEEQQEKLHKEVEMLKVQVEYLNKKKWLLSLSTKFMNWISRNPHNSAQISSATRELLPIEIKDSLAPFPEKEKVEVLEQADNKLKPIKNR